MATTNTTLLDHVTLSNGDSVSEGAAPDLSANQTLEVVITVHEAAEGDSPTLVLLHSADQDGNWLPFDPAVRISLTRATTTWLHVSRFTRYVGWATDGTLDTEAVVSVKLVGKG